MTCPKVDKRKRYLAGFAIGWAFCSLPLGVAAWFAAPELMSRFYKVVETKVLQSNVNANGLVDFTVEWHKLQSGDVRFISFALENRLGARVPVFAYIAQDRCGDKQSFPTHHFARTSWVTRYCFALPTIVDPDQEYWVVGQASYDIPHWPWVVDQDIARFKIRPPDTFQDLPSFGITVPGAQQ